MKRRSGKIFAATLALLVCLNAMPLGTLAAEGEQAEATTTEQQVQPAEQETPVDEPSADGETPVEEKQPVDGETPVGEKTTDDEQAVEEQADDQSGDQAGNEQPVDEETPADEEKPAEQEQPVDDNQSVDEEEQIVYEEQTEESAGAVVLSDEATVSDDAANAQPLADTEATVYYVGGANASDDNGGTKDLPYASLAKAVEKINAGSVDDVTIYLQDDITVTKLARIADKHVTIDGQGHTVTRGAGFAQEQDASRSTYNPGMLEVTTPNGKGASLTLRNITLNDGFKHGGKYFNQAYSATIPDDPDYGHVTLPAYKNNKDLTSAGTERFANADMVQEAIIAAYGLDNCTAEIILDSGTTLQNFGGMSAVRVTGGGKLWMKDGSVIKDTETHLRTKGDPDGDGKIYGYGAVGAVWVQGNGNEANDQFVMDAKAEISDINGRAVYVDGGKATIGGIISNITGNTNTDLKGSKSYMTEGRNGIAIHVRGHASVVFKGTIEKLHGTNSSAVYVVGGSQESQPEFYDFYMDESAVIQNCDSQIKGVSQFGNNSCNVYIDGEITGLKNDNAININVESSSKPCKPLHCTVGHNARIYGNNVRNGAIYIQTVDGTLDIYGQIYDNVNTSNGYSCAGLYMAHNHKESTVTMYDGARISNNKMLNNDKGYAGVVVSKGTFHMLGGEISGNVSKNDYAGVYVQNYGHFIMDGGTITNNVAGGIGGGVLYHASNGADNQPYVQLNGGTITGNLMHAEIGEDGNVSPNTGIANDLAVGYAYDTKNQKSTTSSNINRYFSVSNRVVLDSQDIMLHRYTDTDNKTIVCLTNPAADVKFGNASDASVIALTQASADKGYSNKELVSLWCYSGKGSTELEFSNVPGIDGNLPVYAAVVPVEASGDPAANATVEFYGVTQQDGKLEVTFPASNANGYAVALVQPKANYGTMAITMPETLDQKQADANGNYTLAGSATYDLSKTLSGMMETDGIEAPTFTIHLLKTVTIDPTTVKLDSEIFKAENVEFNNNTLTVTCSLKDDWKTAASTVSTLQWTTVMPESSFTANDSLVAEGEFNATVPSTSQPVSVSVIATPDATLMVSGILIRTADITVYMGGHTDAVVDENGNITVGTAVANAGFPEPGFIVEFPDGVTSANVKFREKDGNKTWTLESYDDKNTKVYKIVPKEGQDPLRVQFTDADGKTALSDAFDVGTAVNQQLTMDLYKGSVGTVEAVVTGADGKQTNYYVTVEPGTLTVRGTTGNVQYGNKIAANDQAPAGLPAVKVAGGTEFYINDSKDVMANADAVQLLFDDVINTTLTQQDRLIQLAQRADTVLGAPATGKVRNFTAKYLDLVDTSNGNAWVKASKDVTVCWPYPEGTDQNTEFTVLHFEGLHRDMAAGEVSGEIATSEVETMTGIVKTATHIEFQTDEFSPFALVWYTDQTVGGGEKDDHGTPSGTTTTVQTTQTTQTTTSASAPAAAAAPAAVIPQTSDNSQPALWVGLLVFSGAALAALYLLKRRKQNGER